jgi:hypothetical protein
MLAIILKWAETVMSSFELWWPTILAGTAVFFASAAAWMYLPHHRRDWSKFPDEERLIQLLAEHNSRPGNYLFPHADTPEEMKSETFQARMRQGPRGTLSLWRNVPRMGRNMTCTYIFYVAVSYVIAYLSAQAMFPGQDFWQVFRFVSTAALLAYCAASIPTAIWFQQTIISHLIDGVAYALITGWIFATCWPT